MLFACKTIFQGYCAPHYRLLACRLESVHVFGKLAQHALVAQTELDKIAQRQRIELYRLVVSIDT